MYRKRKAYLEGMLAAESAKLSSQARFIMEIIERKLVISKAVFLLLFAMCIFPGVSMCILLDV